MPIVTCVMMVTGSRSYTNRLVIRRTIRRQLTDWDVTPKVVGFISGGAKGADKLAFQVADDLGLWMSKPMEPDWPVCAPGCQPHHRQTRQDGTMYCPTAGHRRNQAMVDRLRRFLDADPTHRGACLVFRSLGVSNGTDDCVRRAQAANIPLVYPAIEEFTGDYRFLSNFYPVWITNQDGITYPTLEHAFQAHKTMDLKLRSEIANRADPAEAKSAGRRLTLRADWELVKRDVMTSLLALKFPAPDSALSQRLLDTGNTLLVEGNTWHDQEWGDCQCGASRCQSPGQNWLGTALMERRKTLRT